MKRRQMQAARARMMSAVPEADVVVTNPTHYAVALKYEGEKPRPRWSPRARTSSPRRSAGSPTRTRCRSISDPPLARSLHASVEVGRQIPEELYAGRGAAARVRLPRGRTGRRRELAMAAGMQRMMKHTDLLAAGAVVLVVVMMIVPLPPAIIDLAITLNISMALAIVVATLYLPRALDFAAFPSLLLLTTLFRLAINISVTRLILLHGDAGHVVEAFGNFVVGGNVVVGLIIFLILDRHPVRGDHERRRPRRRGGARASRSTPCPASRWRSTPT